MSNFKPVSMPLDQATDEQLRQFAAGTLGITVAANTGRDKLLAKITAAYDKPEITILVPNDMPDVAHGVAMAANPQDQAPLPPPASNTTGELTEPMWTVKIPKTNDVGGKEPVFLSVNGVAMLVARDKDQIIKHRYYEVLKNARKIEYEQQGEGAEAVMVPNEIQAYGFSVVKSPSDAEIDAWANRNAHLQQAA